MNMVSHFNLVSFSLLCVVVGVSNAQWRNVTNFLSMHRLFGGQEAVEPGQYPFTALIVKPNGYSHCGAVIVTLYHLITAAHCVEQDLSGFFIVAGITDICNAETHSRQVKRIYWYRAHEQYVGDITNDMGYDIAIIAVSTSFTFNEYVQPVTLPTHHLSGSKMCTLTGWGSTTNDPNIAGDVKQPESYPNFVKVPCKLRVGQLATYEEACKQVFPDTYNEQTMLCGGYTNYNQNSGSNGNACQGDSGAPLVCENELHGIVSYGAGYCSFDTAYPTVYTRVSAFLPWIQYMTQMS